MTKQAVLYHFPSKARLLVELSLMGLAEEADAMVDAVSAARSAADAVHRFVRASVAFHCSDLERFRLIYVRPQVVPGAKDSLAPAERAQRIYSATSRIYTALESKLQADPKFPTELDARTLAVAIHLASIGYATMAGELDAGKEQMKLPIARYAEQLAAALGLALGSVRDSAARPLAAPRKKRPRSTNRPRPSRSKSERDKSKGN
jgi:AcrR family transcriptional regulator